MRLEMQYPCVLEVLQNFGLPEAKFFIILNRIFAIKSKFWKA